MWGRAIDRYVAGNTPKRIGKTHPVRNRPAHAGDHGNAASIPEPDDLLRDRLRRHEHPRHVDREHGVGVLGRVVERGRLLLDARRGQQPVQAALRVADRLDGLLQVRDVAHVDAPVVERRAEFFGGALLDAGEIWGLGGVDVSNMHIARPSLMPVDWGSKPSE